MGRATVSSYIFVHKLGSPYARYHSSMRLLFLSFSASCACSSASSHPSTPFSHNLFTLFIARPCSLRALSPSIRRSIFLCVAQGRSSSLHVDESQIAAGRQWTRVKSSGSDQTNAKASSAFLPRLARPARCQANGHDPVVGQKENGSWSRDSKGRRWRYVDRSTAELP